MTTSSMEDLLEPVLNYGSYPGITVDKLWPYLHPPLLIAWLPLMLVPRWKFTKIVTLVLPFLHGVLYSLIYLPIMLKGADPNDEIPPDISSMESIYLQFQKPTTFFIGWTHYLVFDLLVARGIAYDAIENCNISRFKYYTLIIPCLFFCFNGGPIGYTLYMILKGVGLIKANKEKRE